MKLNTRLTAFATAALTIAAFTFTACKKDKNTDAEDTGLGADHATLEKNGSDVLTIADQAGTTGSANYKTGITMLSTCATVINDTSVTPHILTIDFGPTDCLCLDGTYRRGKIIVSYAGRYRDANSTHAITFSNFYQNYNQVTGSKTVTRVADNGQGQPVYNITVNDSVILANGAGTLSWTASRTRTWTGGYTTGTWTDDTYSITGSGTVTRANGRTFQINITTPLEIAMSCKWVESGVVQITPQGGTARTLDYGNGACDDQANYMANGKTYSVTLRH